MNGKIFIIMKYTQAKDLCVLYFSYKKLNKEFFLDMNGKSFYENYIIRELKFSISKIMNFVFKAAQSAPIVILSPISRGFSIKETIINFYI